MPGNDHYAEMLMTAPELEREPDFTMGDGQIKCYADESLPPTIDYIWAELEVGPTEYRANYSAILEENGDAWDHWHDGDLTATRGAQGEGE